MSEILSTFDSLLRDANYIIKINPLHLVGINGYSDNIKNTLFCWRQFYRDQTPLRFVTIENAEVDLSQQAPPSVRPRDFIGINGYRDELENSFFCWRWFNRDGEDFRVVTIEDLPEDKLSPHNGTSKIPGNLF